MDEMRMPDQSPTAAREVPVAIRAKPGIDERTKRTIFTSGSGLGALAMSSCCVVPVALFSLGVTSVWIGNLSALYPYRWIFFALTAGFLAAGFYVVYRKPRASACAPEASCATPLADRITKVVLWSSTVLALVALSFPLWFPYVAPALSGS